MYFLLLLGVFKMENCAGAALYYNYQLSSDN